MRDCAILTPPSLPGSSRSSGSPGTADCRRVRSRRATPATTRRCRSTSRRSSARWRARCWRSAPARDAASGSSGPAVSVKQQIRDDVGSGWTCRGVSAINGAVRRTALRAELGALGLVAHVAKPGYLARIIHLDPRPVLSEIRQPTLALFAEHDPLVIPESKAARLQRFFGTSQANAHLKIATVPIADHFFRNASRCHAGRPRSEWAPGFFDALGDAEHRDWIRYVDAAPMQREARDDSRATQGRSPTAQPPSALRYSTPE
jgi:hypothetical protein